jgi:MYXO-CTERM domain-containing protein
MRYLFALLATGVLAGCVADGSEESLSRSSSPIINGQESTPDEDSAIALVNLPPGGGFSGACSGVLISKQIVLTARHCVAQTEDGGIACTKDGKPIVGGGVVKDYPANYLAVLTGAKLVFEKLSTAPRGKKVIHTGATNLCNSDIALVILDKPVTDAPHAALRLDAPPVKGENILAVGWGQSNNSSGYGRRRRADIPIINVGPASSSTGGAVGPNEFQIGEGICSGDSGGPAYDMTTKAVLGVVSRGGNGKPPASGDPAYAGCVDQGSYVTKNLYTRTDSFKELIMQAFAETGEKPWLEGEPDPSKKPLGDLCASGAECRGSYCIGITKEKNICTQTCADDNPCPEGYTCADVGGTKLCAPAAPANPASDTAPTTSKGGCSMASGSASSPWMALALLALLARRKR